MAGLSGALCLSSWPAQVNATVLTIDTTVLQGTAARLDFSLIDGDFDPGNNSVTIASLSTNGNLGAFDCSVGCSGGPPFTLSDPFGQYLQDLTLGTTLSFDLTFTSNFFGVPNTAPDRLSLSLLDPGTNFTLVDTNLDLPSDPVPYQDALLVVDLAPGSSILLASASDPAVTIVPEPGAATLFALGLAVLGGERIRRRISRVPNRADTVAERVNPLALATRPGE